MDNELVVLFLIIGLAAGSTMGMVTWRLPLMVLQQYQPDDTSFRCNLWLPPSHCCHCKTPLAWYDNIPVFSWLRLKGKCRYCGLHVSWRYPVLEISSAIMAVLCYILHPDALVLALGLFLYFWFALALSVIDFRHLLLPDLLTLPLLWLGLLFNVLSGIVSCEDAILGAVAGYLLLWMIYWIIWLIWHKEGMGFGDFKLLAATGAWTGWQSLPVILYTASLVGIVYGLLLWRRKGRYTGALPFGPALALCGWGYFCWHTL
ncbi:prepilin peptidase [Enterobacter sp. C4G1]|jgi:prepilin signal peptidase PulO-like enzyme (type II secretory pathway)|uniref:prepilin peptidase n=1 Tax=Enterobacter sp. C4G1 TaxID=3458724 RepID=UPI004068E816